jgi:ribosomal protein L32
LFRQLRFLVTLYIFHPREVPYLFHLSPPSPTINWRCLMKPPKSNQSLGVHMKASSACCFWWLATKVTPRKPAYKLFLSLMAIYCYFLNYTKKKRQRYFKFSEKSPQTLEQCHICSVMKLRHRVIQICLATIDRAVNNLTTLKMC